MNIFGSSPIYTSGLPKQFLEERQDVIFRKVRGILNKITPETFDKLSKELVNVGLDSPRTLRGVIYLLFDKALKDLKYSSLYAKLCQELSEKAPNFEQEPGPNTFCKFLISKCEDEFERRRKATEDFDGKNELTDEEFEQKAIAKQKMLGNIKFICELGKKRLLQEEILHECIRGLLSKKKERPIQDQAQDLECLCQIMRTIGSLLDIQASRNLMNQYFERIEMFSKKPELPSRIRFMLKDVIDLRNNNWLPRPFQREDNVPQPLSKLREEAGYDGAQGASIDKLGNNKNLLGIGDLSKLHGSKLSTLLLDDEPSFTTTTDFHWGSTFLPHESAFDLFPSGMSMKENNSKPITQSITTAPSTVSMAKSNPSGNSNFLSPSQQKSPPNQIGSSNHTRLPAQQLNRVDPFFDSFRMKPPPARSIPSVGPNQQQSNANDSMTRFTKEPPAVRGDFGDRPGNANAPAPSPSMNYRDEPKPRNERDVFANFNSRNPPGFGNRSSRGYHPRESNHPFNCRNRNFIDSPRPPFNPRGGGGGDFYPGPQRAHNRRQLDEMPPPSGPPFGLPSTQINNQMPPPVIGQPHSPPSPPGGPPTHHHQQYQHHRLNMKENNPKPLTSSITTPPSIVSSSNRSSSSGPNLLEQQAQQKIAPDVGPSDYNRQPIQHHQNRVESIPDSFRTKPTPSRPIPSSGPDRRSNEIDPVVRFNEPSTGSRGGGGGPEIGSRNPITLAPSSSVNNRDEPNPRHERDVFANFNSRNPSGFANHQSRAYHPRDSSYPFNGRNRFNEPPRSPFNSRGVGGGDFNSGPQRQQARRQLNDVPPSTGPSSGSKFVPPAGSQANPPSAAQSSTSSGPQTNASSGHPSSGPLPSSAHHQAPPSQPPPIVARPHSPPGLPIQHQQQFYQQNHRKTNLNWRKEAASTQSNQSTSGAKDQVPLNLSAITTTPLLSKPTTRLGDANISLRPSHNLTGIRPHIGKSQNSKPATQEASPAKESINRIDCASNHDEAPVKKEAQINPTVIGKSDLNDIKDGNRDLTPKVDAGDVGGSSSTMNAAKNFHVNKFIAVLSEYSNEASLSFTKMASKIRELKIPKSYQDECLVSAMKQSIIKTETDRENISKLMVQLVPSVFEVTSLINAFKIIFEQLQGLEVETPRVKSLVAGFLSQAVHDGVLALEEVGSMLIGGKHHPLFLLILQKLEKKAGQAWLSERFTSSKINLMDMLPEVDRTKSRLASALKDRCLGFLDPMLTIEPDLWAQMRDRDASPAAVYRWIKDNVDQTIQGAPTFAHVLIACLLRYINNAVQEKTRTINNNVEQPKDQSDTDGSSKSSPSNSSSQSAIDVERELLGKYQQVLQALLKDRRMQLATLYALQSFYHGLDFPKGALLRWFHMLYDMNIVDDDVFFIWKEEINDDYPGKGQALFQVNTWLNWLAEAESEEEEEA